MTSPTTSAPQDPTPADTGDSPSPEDAAASARKKKIVIPIVAVLAIALLVWGFNHWNYSRQHQSTDDAQVDGHIVPVIAKVGGYVKSVNVEENQPVKEGQLLVQLDDAEYRVRLAQANADLAAAEAAAGGAGSAGQAQGQVLTASGQEAAMTAQVAAARANARKAESDLARARELAAKQIISRQQLDAAQAAATAANANLTAAERQVSAAGATVSSAQAGVRVASARAQSARAMRDNALLQLQYTRITAPASGFASKKSVELGQLVAAGQPVMNIVADTGVWVTANFKETQLAKIHAGQPAEFEVDAYGGCVALGTVQSLSGATGAKFALLPPDNATGNFTKVVQRVPVRIAVTRPCSGNRPLRPGLSVTVHVETNK
jgi:membrane fusion protein (multidrug efflux system)